MKDNYTTIGALGILLIAFFLNGGHPSALVDPFAAPSAEILTLEPGELVHVEHRQLTAEQMRNAWLTCARDAIAGTSPTEVRGPDGVIPSEDEATTKPSPSSSPKRPSELLQKVEKFLEASLIEGKYGEKGDTVPVRLTTRSRDQGGYPSVAFVVEPPAPLASNWSHELTTAIYLPESNTLQLRHVEEFSRSYNGLMLIHEAIRAMGKMETGTVAEELEAYEGELEALASINEVICPEIVQARAAIIESRLELENGIIKKPLGAPQVKDYDGRIDELLGRSHSESEQRSRMALIQVAAVFSLLEQRLDYDRAQVAKRQLFLAR